MELAAHEESMCRCGCNQPAYISADPKQAFRVDVATCYAGRALAQEDRRRRDDAKQHNKPDGWDDGQHLVVSPADIDQPARGGAHGD